MATPTKKDKYVNVLNQTITMSAADTLTFQEISMGLNLFDKVGILIHQVRIDISNAALLGLAEDSDEIEVAMTTSNQLDSLSLTQQAVIDRFSLKASEIGTAASLVIFREPFILDYTMLPESGLLVAPKPLYLGMETAGLASAASANIRLFFTVVQLKSEDYFELLESRQFFG